VSPRLLGRPRQLDLEAVPLTEWRALFEDSPLAIAYLSPDLRLMRVNGPFAVLCGRMAGEMLGRHCYEVLGECAEGPAGSEERRPCSACGAVECLRTGVLQRFERTLGDRLVRAVATPMRNRWGGMLGALLMFDDATAERDLRRQLLESQRLAAVGLMTSEVAHELKNPLTSIVGFAQLLRRRGDLPQDAKAHLELVFHEAQRCERIVANLLRFARRKPEEKAIVDIARVVREALDLQRYQLAANGIQLHEDHPPAPLRALTDPYQLHQVVQNIVSNALDAITEAGRGGTLIVRTRQEEGCVLIEFQNDGPQIAEPDKVFLPLYTTKPPGKGTGLGLSVSQEIIHQHAGTIRAMNLPDGVLFRISLPAAAEPAPALESASA